MPVAIRLKSDFRQVPSISPRSALRSHRFLYLSLFLKILLIDSFSHSLVYLSESAPTRTRGAGQRRTREQTPC